MSWYIGACLLRTQLKQPQTLKGSDREEENIAPQLTTTTSITKVLLGCQADQRRNYWYKEKEELSSSLYVGRDLGNTKDLSHPLDPKLMAHKDAKTPYFRIPNPKVTVQF